MEHNILRKEKTGINPDFQVKYKISIPKINLTEMPIFSNTNANMPDSRIIDIHLNVIKDLSVTIMATQLTKLIFFYISKNRYNEIF